MTIVVTGATRGLGLAIARGLMKSGERVITVGRDGCDVVGDLSRMDDVRRIAADLGDVDVLISNAGVSKFTREVTPDGLEVTFATNYLAAFLLSDLLVDRLTAIVNISSEQHRWVRAIPWDDLQGERHFNPIQQYSLTKLYEVLFTRELARRAPKVKVNCVRAFCAPTWAARPEAPSESSLPWRGHSSSQLTTARRTCSACSTRRSPARTFEVVSRSSRARSPAIRSPRLVCGTSASG